MDSNEVSGASRLTNRQKSSIQSQWFKPTSGDRSGHRTHYRSAFRVASHDRVEWQSTDGAKYQLNRTVSLLLALLSVLVGAIGVVQGISAWLNNRRQSIAIYRCMGISNRELISIYGCCVLILGFIGSCIGILLSVGGLWGLSQIVSPYLPVELNSRLSPAAAFEGLSVGMIAGCGRRTCHYAACSPSLPSPHFASTLTPCDSPQGTRDVGDTDDSYRNRALYLASPTRDDRSTLRGCRFIPNGCLGWHSQVGNHHTGPYKA